MIMMGDDDDDDDIMFCMLCCLSQCPWGGFKRSGIGRDLGRAGFHSYLEVKQVRYYYYYYNYYYYYYHNNYK